MIIGIGGVSRSGKSTLAKQIAAFYSNQGQTVEVFSQDDFVVPVDQIPLIRNRTDWECPESIDFERFIRQLKESSGKVDIVIGEGLLAFWHSGLNQLYDRRIFMEIDRETFLQRRRQEERWGPEPEWFLHHVWDSYLKYGWQNPEEEEILRLKGTGPVNMEEITDYLLG